MSSEVIIVSIINEYTNLRYTSYYSLFYDNNVAIILGQLKENMYVIK